MTSPLVLEEIQEIIEDDPIHLTCCDDDLSMCGLDVSDHSWKESGAGEDKDCALCTYISDNNLPCPVPGCEPDVWAG